MQDSIERAEIWNVALPMRWQLNIGPITYPTRDYVILRLTSRDGHQGIAVGYTRGTPLVHSLSTLLEDLSVLSGEPEDVQDRLRMRFATGWGAFVRGVSLIDVALWDIKARRQGVSLSTALGERPAELELMVVAGYFADQRSQGAILDEIERFVADGYTTIKLIIGGRDIRADHAYVERVQQRVGPLINVAIDLHGAYLTAESARPYVQSFAGMGLAFVEDPLPSVEIDEIRDLIESTDVPIAAGEDLVTSSAYNALVHAGVTALRVDVTATCGYTGVLRGINAAQSHQRKVYPHVWPYLHAPLASVAKCVTAVEVIPEYVQADPLMEYMLEPLPLRNGKWVVPADPGLHLPIDWERLGAAAGPPVTITAGDKKIATGHPVSKPEPALPTIAITGGGSGLGAAVAEIWVDQGGFAILLDLDESAMSRVIAQLRRPEHCLGVVADVSDDSSIRNAFEQIRDLRYGRLDCLVNCAGIARPAPAAEVAMERWAELVSVHLVGTMRTCQAAYPLLKASDNGCVVNISSVASVLGMPGRSSYAAAKAGIEGLTRALAVEWAPDGIRVNAVAPGYIDTHMTAGLVAAGHLRLEPILSRTPMHRLAAPREIAEAVSYLASPEASYVTGQVLRVDGGMTVEGNWYA
jgi:NAD(P)-dependent dehydrogenase (short-subunit alcohol dehydrogenase family)/L-alanine-DL-glutamate epimerase-like enolase superfamily enzyme